MKRDGHLPLLASHAALLAVLRYSSPLIGQMTGHAGTV
jgi:hypothetical protein